MDATLTRDAVLVEGLGLQRGSFALQDLSVEVPVGYITGLVGPNGAGKTTLIKVLLGLVRPTSGRVTLFGDQDAGAAAARERIGVVLDRVTAAPEWRAGSIGGRIGGLYRQWDEALFRELLDRFGVPRGTRVGALSRGQSVKLSLAMALAHHPELLLLDEPSSGLDPVARRELADTLREFMLDPTHTVLFSTHITSELDQLADHIIVLSGGRVMYSGLLSELHERFAIVRGRGAVPAGGRPALIGLREGLGGVYEGLIRIEDTARFGPEVVIEAASTDEVVVSFAGRSSSGGSQDWNRSMNGEMP